MRIRSLAVLALIFAAVIGRAILPGSQPSHAEPVVTSNLYAGWNTFVYLGASGPVANALASVAGQYNQVCQLKGQQQDWDCNDPNAPPALNELQNLEQFGAYMISVNIEGTLTFDIGLPKPAVTTALYNGWNLFAYLGQGNPVADALSAVAGKYNAVCLLKGQQQDWDCNDPTAPPALNELQQLEQFTAYMIFMTAEGGLTFDLGGRPQVEELIIGEDWRDYGDAPDGAPTEYSSGATAGSFPTTPANNGPFHPWPFKVWLGEFASVEPEPALGNDASDDGLQWLDLTACATSEALVMVNLSGLSAEERAQPLLLNLLADWNRDGQWQGSDNCAQEWAVQNQPLDLSGQAPDSSLLVLVVDVPSGAQVNEFWLRLMVGRQPYDPAVGGEIEGETEDYFVSGSRVAASASTRVAKLFAPLLNPDPANEAFFCRGGVVFHSGPKQPAKLVLTIEQTQKSKEDGLRPTNLQLGYGAPTDKDGKGATGVSWPENFKPGLDVSRSNDGRYIVEAKLEVISKFDRPLRLEGPFITTMKMQIQSNKGAQKHDVACKFYILHADDAAVHDLDPKTTGFTGGPGHFPGNTPGKDGDKFIYIIHGTKVDPKTGKGALVTDASDDVKSGTYNKDAKGNPKPPIIFDKDGKQVAKPGDASIEKVHVSSDGRGILIQTKKDPPNRTEMYILWLTGTLADGTTRFDDFYRVVIVHDNNAGNEKKLKEIKKKFEENTAAYRTIDNNLPHEVTYSVDQTSIREKTPTYAGLAWPEETICVIGDGLDGVRGVMHSSVGNAIVGEHEVGPTNVFAIHTDNLGNGDPENPPTCIELDVNLTNHEPAGPSFPAVFFRGSHMYNTTDDEDFEDFFDPNKICVSGRVFGVPAAMPFLIEVMGGSTVPIDGGEDGRTPVCVDGRALFSRTQEDGGLGLYRLPVTCGGTCLEVAQAGQVQPTQILTSGSANVWLVQPVLSPNGSKLAYSRWVVDAGGNPTDQDIYVADFNLTNWTVSNPRALTSDGNNLSPTWSWDSQELAFVSTRDGNAEIYVMNADGSQQRNITNTPDRNESDPSWMVP